MTVELLKANFKIIMCAVLMTVRNNLEIGSMFHNLRKMIVIMCVYNHISGGQMTWWSDVAVREAQTTRGLHGWVMYVCLFHKNASQISHFFLFFSYTYGTAPILLSSGSKRTSCSEMPWSVWLPLSHVVLDYISFLAVSAFLTYLKNSNLSRGPTSRTGSFLLPP